jgi:geranylgeranyl diphosphate synthase, type I
MTKIHMRTKASRSEVAAVVSYEETSSQYLEAIHARMEASKLARGLAREMLDYHMTTMGKRMRAILPVWVCRNLGGDPEAAFDFGAGFELMHNATLVHDDFQDGDTHRRGQPTVWRRWGAAQAVGAGDVLIFEAFTRLAQAPAAPRVLAAISNDLTRVAEGQVMDLQSTFPEMITCGPKPTTALWECVARYKTGAFFAACLRAGAAAAGAADDVVENLAAYGEELGVLFQLQDDVLDLMGNKGREHPGADLLEGKLSYPVAWMYELGAAVCGPLRDVLERPRAERTWLLVAEAVAALRRTGAIADAVQRIVRMKSVLEKSPLAWVVPGLVQRILSPISHVLDSALDWRARLGATPRSIPTR